jgi:hypothetical protein
MSTGGLLKGTPWSTKINHKKKLYMKFPGWVNISGLAAGLYSEEKYLWTR